MPMVSTDRWTCPGCGRTTVVDALSQLDIDAALDAVRTRHGKGHHDAAVLPTQQRRGHTARRP